MRLLVEYTRSTAVQAHLHRVPRVLAKSVAKPAVAAVAGEADEASPAVAGDRLETMVEEAVEEQARENEILARRNAELQAEVEDLRQGLEAIEERLESTGSQTLSTQFSAFIDLLLKKKQIDKLRNLRKPH